MSSPQRLVRPPRHGTAEQGDHVLRGVRILFVLPSLGLGGAERQALLLARHLRANLQADVRIVAMSRESGLVEACEAAHIPHAFFDLTHAYRSRLGHLKDLLRFVLLLRRERAQIVLPYCMFQNVLCGLTWWTGGASVCIWNQRDEGRARLEGWIERIAVRTLRRFVSNSRHGAAFLTEHLHVPAEMVSLVANGVEMPEPGPSRTNMRDALGLPPGALVACMVANLHGKKDHATLLAAWRLVIDRQPEGSPPPHLLLAGSFGDRHDALVQQAMALSIEDRVHFLGTVHDVNDLLRSVDLAVFSSFTEGVPNAVLEAMAHGLPVVGTDFEGIQEAVGPEGAGLLAAPRDPEQLAERILMTAADPVLRARIGQRARERAMDVFGVDRMVSEMTGIIAAEWARAGR